MRERGRGSVRGSVRGRGRGRGRGRCGIQSAFFFFLFSLSLPLPLSLPLSLSLSQDIKAISSHPLPGYIVASVKVGGRALIGEINIF